ncbi:glycosyltransferase [Leptothoe sp. PORK10 BA2]|uniref:glycosyltransferase n=1 Tax=Leptothoe sp. PORK10 BA2 TaxID=3110254 RepID=UPI002B210C91|nr:glycosyltransferase [Leptothoe sp. PORK10 BA2]MEA5465665.1 glycosyltransferase [Leptothoe sp. PORK10 BA2]
MKIAFFLGEFPAISQTFILDQIVGLIQQGHEVDVFATTVSDEDTVHPEINKYSLLERTYYWPKIPQNYILRAFKGLKLATLNIFQNSLLILKSLNIFKHGKNAASLRLLYLCIPFINRQACYDIIQCHFGWSGLQGMHVRNIGAIDGKLITTFHGFDVTKSVHEFGESVYSSLFLEGDLFSPISNYWKQKLIQMGCDEHKLFVHRMGIDLRKFAASTAYKHKSKEIIRLVSVSRLVEKKGLEYAIRAIAKILKDRKIANIEYNIIGDGDLRDKLQQLITDLNLSDCIILHGQKKSNDVVALLNRSHVLLAPSVTSKDGDMEGIPVVLMEAMAMELPVISTYHSGIPELVDDGISGFLVPERDIDNLADRICYLMDHPDESEEMGKAGKLKIVRDYNLEQLNERLEKLYQKILFEPSFELATTH